MREPGKGQVPTCVALTLADAFVKAILLDTREVKLRGGEQGESRASPALSPHAGFCSAGAWLLLPTRCFKKSFRVWVLELQQSWSIREPSLKMEWSEHGPNSRAHQDDRCFLEYRLQVHKDAGDTGELLQEPHPHRNQDGLVNKGALDLGTGNPPALEGTKPES